MSSWSTSARRNAYEIRRRAAGAWGQVRKTGTLTAADAGVHVFPGLVLVTAGDQTITVMDIATGLLSGSATATIRPGATPFTYQGWNSQPQVFPAFGFPSWAIVPRLPEVPALVAGPIGDPRADETRSVGGAEVDSFPIALVESEEAFRPLTSPGWCGAGG